MDNDKLIYDYSCGRKSTIVKTGGNAAVEEFIDLCKNDDFIIDAYVCRSVRFSQSSELDYMIHIVKTVDWSAWYDIYNDRIDKRYEYCGVICKSCEGDHYAPILFRGNKYSVGGNGCNVINIHSHPVYMSRYGDRWITNELPSISDCIANLNKLSILVCYHGIVIYGVDHTKNLDTHDLNKDTIKCIMDDDDVVAVFLSWDLLDTKYSKRAQLNVQSMIRQMRRKIIFDYYIDYSDPNNYDFLSYHTDGDKYDEYDE